MNEHRAQDELSIDTIIEEPDPAHISEEDRHASDDEFEATELRQMHCERPRLSRVMTQGKPMRRWYDPFRRFWRHQIRISVPHEDCRDHLANERTYLGYLRTSIALSMMGAVIAQLFQLQHHPDPSTVLDYHVLSKPLAAIFQSAALLVALMGGIRFWRQQSAMAIGRVRAGGWELIAAGVGTLALLTTLFVLLVAIDITKGDEDELG